MSDGIPTLSLAFITHEILGQHNWWCGLAHNKTSIRAALVSLFRQVGFHLMRALSMRDRAVLTVIKGQGICVGTVIRSQGKAGSNGYKLTDTCLLYLTGNKKATCLMMPLEELSLIKLKLLECSRLWFKLDSTVYLKD